MNHRIWALDVWGNDDDGYWVNDRMPIGEIDLPHEPSDAQVIFSLREKGILTPQAEVEVDDTGWPNFNIDTVNGKPLLTLEEMEKGDLCQ